MDPCVVAGLCTRLDLLACTGPGAYRSVTVPCPHTDRAGGPIVAQEVLWMAGCLSSSTCLDDRSLGIRLPTIHAPTTPESDLCHGTCNIGSNASSLPIDVSRGLRKPDDSTDEFHRRLAMLRHSACRPSSWGAPLVDGDFVALSASDLRREDRRYPCSPV